MALLRTEESAAIRNPLRWGFPAAFALACMLFWWLPSLLLPWLGLPDPIESRTFTYSVLALALFLLGFVVPLRPSRPLISHSTMNLCERFAWKATIMLAGPASLVGVVFASYRAGVAYGEGHDIPLLFQAVLYTHLFFGYMYLGSVTGIEGRNRRRILLASTLLIVPRLLIALHWARFFVGQTVVVIFLIAIARGWLRLSVIRVVLLAVIAMLIIFVPQLTRGGSLGGNDAYGRPKIVLFFQSGGTLEFLQNYQTGLHWDCPPLLVSMTAKLIPYHLIGVCTTDVGNAKGVPATINTLLTRQESDDLASGTGGIYLLELFLLGGIWAVAAGSAIFGLTCRWFVEQLTKRSLVSGVWAECLVRALFAPRDNLGYVYERIPSLLCATLAAVALCRVAVILRQLPTALDRELRA